MTKKILSLFIIMTAMGFMACQRQGSTNGKFQSAGTIVSSQFNFRVDTVTNKGYAELIIYEEDVRTINAKYTFNFPADKISEEDKGNDEIHKISARANEDPSILAHITIIDTPEYRNTDSTRETWIITKSEVTLFKADPTIALEPDVSIGTPTIANSENVSDALKMLGKHEGKHTTFESSEPRLRSSERSFEEAPYQRRFAPRRPLK